MLDFIEVNPLPEVCKDCNDDCYNCDNALDRWGLSKEQQLKNIIRYKITHIKLLKRQLQEAESDNKKGKKDSYIKLLNR